MTEKSPPPQKNPVYMPKHIFTSTALISLQPQAHKSSQCVCSAGKQKQLMVTAEGWIYTAGRALWPEATLSAAAAAAYTRESIQ